MKITDKTIEAIKQSGYDCIFYDEYINEVNPAKATHLQVFAFDPIYVSYNFNAPKSKEITLEWVLLKIAQRENCVSINWDKVFAPLNLFNVGFYTTSYGIGVETIFSSRDETRQKIDEFLKSKNIDFTNEYSEAGWVFRYKISKAKENIDKIRLLESNNI